MTNEKLYRKYTVEEFDRWFLAVAKDMGHTTAEEYRLNINISSEDFELYRYCKKPLPAGLMEKLWGKSQNEAAYIHNSKSAPNSFGEKTKNTNLNANDIKNFITGLLNNVHTMDPELKSKLTKLTSSDNTDDLASQLHLLEDSILESIKADPNTPAGIKSIANAIFEKTAMHIWNNETVPADTIADARKHLEGR